MSNNAIFGIVVGILILVIGNIIAIEYRIKREKVEERKKLSNGTTCPACPVCPGV